MAESHDQEFNLNEASAGEQLRRLLRAARENRYRIVMFAAVGMILGGMIATVVPDLYESKTLLLLRDHQLIDDSKMIKAIQDKPLAQKEQTLMSELRSFRWILDVLQRVEWVEFAEARNDPARLAQLVEKVRDPKYFDVEIDTDAAGELLVTLAFRWFEPRKAHDFVLEARRSWINRRDEESKLYWGTKLKQAEAIVQTRRQEYEESSGNRENYLREHELQLDDDFKGDAEFLSTLRSRRSIAQEALTEVEISIRGLQERLDQTPSRFKTEVKEPNPQYESAKEALQRERSRLEDLLETKRETHPFVQKQREKVQIAEQLFATMEGKQFAVDKEVEVVNETWLELDKKLNLEIPKVASLQERINELDRQIDEAELKMVNQPTLRSQLEKLTNRYRVAEENLNAALIDIAPLRDRVFQMQNRDTRLFADAEEELRAAHAFEILEDPVVPNQPVGFPKPVFVLIGALFGIALALAMALLQELTRSTFDGVDEVQQSLRMPVLGAIGRIATGGELRREKMLGITRMAGSVLIIGTLGVLVYILTAHPEMLPSRVQQTIEDLRTTFQ